jgi:hypothetical protein
MRCESLLQSTIPMLSSTKRPSMTKTRNPYASSWSLPMGVICRYYKILFRVKLSHITNEAVASPKRRCGESPTIYLMDFILYKTKKYCIAISRVPMCFSLKVWPSWATWMCQRWRNHRWRILKQARLTTLAQKSGVKSHTATKVIFGHWDVFCMRCALWDHHSGQKASNSYTRKYKKECSSECLWDIHNR